MELRHLRYFVAVAEELHFGRAAQRLNISQPPLSQQIRALEETIGVVLFIRDTRRVELTAAGKDLLKYARAALSQVEQGVRSAQRIHQGEVGRLSVGFITSLAYTYLPWIVRAFRDRFPQVDLVLAEQESWDQAEALQGQRLDIGIMRRPLEPRDLHIETVLDEPFMIALPDNHRLACRERIDLRTLKADPFIVFPRIIGGSFHLAVSAFFDAAGFSPLVAQEAVQMHVVVGLVSARLGVAIVPSSMRLLQIPGVVLRYLKQNPARAELVVGYHAKAGSALIRAFAETSAVVIHGHRGAPGGRSGR